MKWLDDIQGDIYPHEQEKNEPIMHVEPGYLNTMGSESVSPQLDLRHLDNLEQIETGNNSDSVPISWGRINLFWHPLSIEKNHNQQTIYTNKHKNQLNFLQH